MKIRALLLVAGLAVLPLAWTAAAQAQELPDLPGMGAASKLVGGQAPTGDDTTQAQKAGGGTTESTVTDAAGADSAGADATDTASLPDLPGLDMLPAIKAEKAKASLPVPGAGLEAWAALGTVAAVGGLYALRRFGVI